MITKLTFGCLCVNCKDHTSCPTQKYKSSLPPSRVSCLRVIPIETFWPSQAGNLKCSTIFESQLTGYLNMPLFMFTFSALVTSTSGISILLELECLRCVARNKEPDYGSILWPSQLQACQEPDANIESLAVNSEKSPTPAYSEVLKTEMIQIFLR